MIDGSSASPENSAPVRSGVADAFPPGDVPELQLPTKEVLEREHLYLENEKLRIETTTLRNGLKPEKWWAKLVKNIVTLGGAVAVAASIYGIWDSYDKTIVDRERTRQERERTRTAEQHTRFEDAIKRLESTNTISKLVGVSVLSGYLDASNKEAHRQILFTLAGLIATEKDTQTQAVVVNLLASIPKEGAISRQDWLYFQEMLVTQSRALMGRNNAFSRRQQFFDSFLNEEERIARTIGKLIAQNARKGVLSGYKDYRGIYCVECDFSGVVFPNGADFASSALDRSNFSGAKLAAAIFDNAGLAGTRFIETDLRNALFRSLDPDSVNLPGSGRLVFGSTRYLRDSASTLEKNANIYVVMPNFSCANLSGAYFHGHGLFPGVIPFRRTYSKASSEKPAWHQSFPADQTALEQFSEAEFSPVIVSPPKLFKANLKGIHLDQSRFFSVSTVSEFSSTLMSSASSTSFNEVALYEGRMKETAFKIDGRGSSNSAEKLPPDELKTIELVDSFQRALRASFYMAQTGEASLPQDLSLFLKNSPPTDDDFRTTFPHPISSGSAFDIDCKPENAIGAAGGGSNPVSRR
ncbi:pentapeptide repeat-containing protein [Bradyrhizobium sp. CCGB12]|uniref:pentapeptide repeat-containing protein n=1 Tax=Bradyrhizobium sp. CCGB12 TaxID=2949632 RepID=UPI0020B28AC8|nr:pentapeptide repeat-containing protein [Bradyrhizobium sp. CCGB12]MCP3391524.1 pentapeptide repeat-containing protein [Bradyrhizobium sp. CCGB12]